jgi:phosphoserine phosphatase RsbU/P
VTDAPSRNFLAAAFARLRALRASGRLKVTGLRLFLLAIAAMVLGAVFSGPLSGLFRILEYLCWAALGLRLAARFIRWIFNTVLWTVRSRLIVTCLLMGLAPIVLFGTLAGIAGYIFCGQFATSIVAEGISDNLNRAQARSMVELSQLERADAGARTIVADDREGRFMTVWRDGKQQDAGAAKNSLRQASPFASGPIPGWLHPGFKGVVVASGKLFLCAASGNAAEGHSAVLLNCTQLGNQEVRSLAEGLGDVRIRAALVANTHGAKATGATTADPADQPGAFHTLAGGDVAARVNVFDIRVFFTAPLATTDFATGEDDNVYMFVTSRPAMLYRRLFASSVEAGTIVHIILIVTAVVFGVLELFACLMAIAVSLTITRSIADLYDATREIDKGNLDHRIPVRRKDQLAALAGSFNSMTASLKALLKEQREKDRMQNELKIAQEVQNNLFPHAAIQLPDFEVFGVCEPARTIGGDYYDFIPFGESQLYLALGDISGKGISAALLMASLHSAVRAYRIGEGSEAAQGDGQGDGLDGADLGVSPGRMLALLNQHLYSSTQPEKYATLFLACYDGATRLLTYSNGGHLPPVLLSANGEVQHLDCGGSVVGLLPGMQYSEATIQLNRGDLIVAYSDGLTEPERETVDFGEERLIEVIRRNQILPLPDIAARALGAVQAWIGDAEQPDDMTLVLARLS